MPIESAHDPEFFTLPFPKDFADEKDEDVLARANAMVGAAEAIYGLATKSGQTITVTDDDRLLARSAHDNPEIAVKVHKTAVAIHLSALLQEYDHTVVESSQQLRNFCTNLLIEKAANGKTDQVQLRAVEMIAKIKDVALFDERSTVLVEHMTTDEIQMQLREKVNRMRSLISAQPITDVEPVDVEPKA